MFYRKIQGKLYDYYNSEDDAIMVVTGARQVGEELHHKRDSKKEF